VVKTIIHSTIQMLSLHKPERRRWHRANSGTISIAPAARMHLKKIRAPPSTTFHSYLLRELQWLACWPNIFGNIVARPFCHCVSSSMPTI